MNNSTLPTSDNQNMTTHGATIEHLPSKPRKKLFLLLAIALLLITAGALYAWQRPQKDNLASSQPQPSVTTSSMPTPPGIPVGYTEYKNTSIGFSFAYPDEWGELTLGKEEGVYITGIFSNNNNFYISLQKKDGIPPAGTDDPTYNLFGYKKQGSDYVLLKAGQSIIEEPVVQEDVLAYSDAAGSSFLIFRGQSLGYYFHGLGRLENNPHYDSVTFRSPRGSMDKPFTKDDIAVKQMIVILQTFRGAK